MSRDKSLFLGSLLFVVIGCFIVGHALQMAVHEPRLAYFLLGITCVFTALPLILATLLVIIEDARAQDGVVDW